MAVATKRVFVGAVVMVLFLGVAGLLAVFGWNAVRGVQRNRVIFPDGTRFTLVTAAPQGQPFTSDNRWQKELRRLLPYRWQRWMPGVVSSTVSAGTNDVVVWFKLLDAKGANVSTEPWAWCCAVSEDGFQYPFAAGGGSTSNGRNTFHQMILQAFPRRQKVFELQFFDANMRLLGSVHVPNPIPRSFPEWKPEPLPITHTNETLIVTLQSLTERSNRFVPYSRWVSSKWKLETSDPLWEGARPASEEWFDATGNHGGLLSLKEHAWKLQLPFRRPNPEKYLPEEKFAMSDLAIPEPGSVQVFTNQYERLGIKFSIRCLAGVGTLAITNGTNFAMISSSGSSGSGWSTTINSLYKEETLSSPRPFFLVEARGITALDEIRVRILDGHGKELSRGSYDSYSDGTGKSFYRPSFDGTNVEGRIRLEFIVSRARLVEFVVDPAEMRRAK